jgi:phage-related tail protein
VAAAIRYIVARYGNITNVQQANANMPPKGYEGGTPGATRGWHLVGESGPELVKFRGGERVLDNKDTWELLSRDNGGNVEINVPITVNGSLDRAAVDKIEKEMIPKLRMMLQQQVGRRSRP